MRDDAGRGKTPVRVLMTWFWFFRHNTDTPIGTTVELPESLHESLRRRAERSGASIPALIVSAIEQVYRERKKGDYVTGPLVNGPRQTGSRLP